jgi:hypothetical protein
MDTTCNFLNEIKSVNDFTSDLSEPAITDYQIIRQSRTQSGQRYRTVIDTIRVKDGLVEIAFKRAIAKAKTIGNCIVIELTEKQISVI